MTKRIVGEISKRLQRIVSEISRRLRLEERAGQDATNGAPMGGVIPEIVDAAKREGRERLDDLENHCREAEKKTRGVQKAVRDADAELDSPNYGVKPSSFNVEVAEQKRKRAEADFNTFKDENNIARGASGDDRLTQIVWAVCIVVAEGALNSFFFARGVEGGLVGGFIIAFCISAINVAFAFIGGAAGLRYGLYHCKPPLQMGGIAVFLFCAAMCAAVVALSSCIRANMDLLLNRGDADIPKLLDMAWALSMEDMRQMNWGRLVSSPFAFFLVCIGGLCAFLGFWKGHAFDDCYPGFGRMNRLLENARDEYEDAQKEYNNALAKWRKDKNDTLNKTANGMEREYLKAQAAADAMTDKSKDAADLPADMQQLAQALLNRYYNRYQTISPVSSPAPDAIAGAPFSALADECREHVKTAAEIKKRFKDAEEAYFRIQDKIERKLGAGDTE